MTVDVYFTQASNASAGDDFGGSNNFVTAMVRDTNTGIFVTVEAVAADSARFRIVSDADIVLANVYWQAIGTKA